VCSTQQLQTADTEQQFQQSLLQHAVQQALASRLACSASSQMLLFVLTRRVFPPFFLRTAPAVDCVHSGCR
jgi:hypothetical protein